MIFYCKITVDFVILCHTETLININQYNKIMKAIEKIIAITSPTDVVVNDGNTLIIDTINKKFIFDNMTINLSSIESSITSIGSSITSIESDITGIESSIGSIESDITDIESDITDITTRVTALETPTEP